MSWWSQEQFQHVTCWAALLNHLGVYQKMWRSPQTMQEGFAGCWQYGSGPQVIFSLFRTKNLADSCDDMWLHVMAKSKHTTSRMVVKWQMRWKTRRRQQGLVEHTSCGKDTWLADVGSSSCGSWARYGLPLQPFSGVYCLSLNLHLAGRSQCQNSQGGTQGVGDGQWSYDKGMIYGCFQKYGYPQIIH